jgi:hypothetical protein
VLLPEQGTTRFWGKGEQLLNTTTSVIANPKQASSSEDEYSNTSDSYLMGISKTK